MESTISKNDKNVLQMILNPNLPIDNDGDEGVIANGSVDPDSVFDQEKLLKAKDFEKTGIKHAEAEQFQESLKCFDEAIQLLPERASGYNNRAQSKRLAGDADGALEDLNKAISLSGNNKKVASLAYAQRALLLKLNGKAEEAVEDLKKAAELGNRFAKQELVQMNPYAAMCNQMLTKVIGDLQRGATDQCYNDPNKRARR